MSLFESASLVVTPNGTKASKLYAIKPTDGSGDLSVTRATTATRVNSNGLIESVSSNVPRLDYSNGTCPSILVEPQRTNLTLYSQQFTNGIWSTKSGTFTDNYGISPDGTTNATRFVSTDSDPYVYQPIIGDGSTYTVSCYVKGIGSSIGKSGSIRVSANSQSFTITNQWQRVTLTCTITGALIMGLEIPDGASVGDEVLIWGYQCEKGSYATSYIPTVASAVTRNADVISKTGISDLIGQIEGTMYAEVDTGLLNSGGVLLMLSNGSFANFIILAINSSNRIELAWRTNASPVNVFATPNDVSIAKIAVAYEADNIVFFVNGNLINTGSVDVNWSVPLSQLDLGNELGSVARLQRNNSAQVYKTRLSNSELAQLTTL